MIIVGAGPGGLTAATRLSKIKFLVLENSPSVTTASPDRSHTMVRCFGMHARMSARATLPAARLLHSITMQVHSTRINAVEQLECRMQLTKERAAKSLGVELRDAGPAVTGARPNRVSHPISFSCWTAGTLMYTHTLCHTRS